MGIFKSLNKKIMWSVIWAVIVTFFISWFVCSNRSVGEVATHNGPVRISGDVLFNALTPEENDKGKILFEIRKHNTTDAFASATMLITPSFTNGGQWVMGELEEGISYDVKAILVIDGEEIIQSQIATVSAPARDVVLKFTIGSDDLPAGSIKASENKTISGDLVISGHIPERAFYTIFAAPVRDESDFGEEGNDLKFIKAVNKQLADVDNSWNWDRALAKADYRVRAELYTESGDYIGTSSIVDAVVSQNDVSLILDSKAVTEPVRIPLAGTVTLNGSYKSDSVVSVQVREDGSSEYIGVDSFPAEGHREWLYTDAKAGIKYDVRAVLERNGEGQATSHQKQLTAPSRNVALTINTDYTLEDPTDRPEVVTCVEKGGGKYDATIKFAGIDNAKAYWVRVGKENNSGDRFNESEKPENDSDAVEVKIRIDKDQYYYTDYAYSYCSDCTMLGSYSNFSSSLKFYCGDQPEDD